MSVINTMLKDLERRGVGGKQGNDILGDLSANKHSISEAGLSANVYLISLLSIFSILAVIVAIYYLSPYKIVSVAQETVDGSFVTAQASAIELQAIDQPAVAPAVTTPALVAEKTSAVISKQKVQAAAKTIQASPVVSNIEQRAEQQSSVAETTAVVNKQQQLSATIIKPAAETRSARKTLSVKKSVTAEADRSVQAGEDTAEALAVVSKKQREYTPQEKSTQAYREAASLYKQGSKQQAKASLKEAIAYSGNNINAYSLLAVIYLEDGRGELATETIEAGLIKHQDDQALLRLYLQSLVQETRYKEAVAVMEKRLQLTSPEDIGYLAGLYQKLNDHLSAVKYYARALQLRPSTSLWWMGQGISLEVMEKYEEALQSYQLSINTGQLSGKLAQYAISRMNTIKQHNADLVS